VTSTGALDHYLFTRGFTEECIGVQGSGPIMMDRREACATGAELPYLVTFPLPLPMAAHMHVLC